MIKVFCHAAELGVAQQILSIKNLLNHEVYSFSTEVFNDAGQILTTHGSIKDSDISICGFDSISENRTSVFLKKINDHKIKSIGILDTWKGIDRFFFEDGSHRDLTDIILVFDEFSKSYLINKGIPEKKLEVSTDFFLDEILQCLECNRTNLTTKNELLNDLQFDLDKPNLFFFSEPIIDNRGYFVSLFDYETNVGNMSTGDFLYESYKDEYNLFLRRHPKELNSDNKWINANNFSLFEIFNMADKVTGLSSTPIYYSSQIGLDVLNLSDLLLDWKPEYSQLPDTIWRHIKHLYNGKIDKNRSTNDPNHLDKLIRELI